MKGRVGLEEEDALSCFQAPTKNKANMLELNSASQYEDCMSSTISIAVAATQSEYS